MIPRLIPSVHRFVHTLLVVAVFLIPSAAFASTQVHVTITSAGVITDGDGISGSYALDYFNLYPDISSVVLCDSGSSFTPPYDVNTHLNLGCASNTGYGHYKIGDAAHYDYVAGTPGGTDWTREDYTLNTRIISFTPADGATISGPSVDIHEHVYINPSDLDGSLGIRLTLHNIDQNVLFLGFLSPSDIMIYDGEATTSGDVYLGGTYPLGDGNYRLNATLTRSYLYGWVANPFSSINQDQSHQFIVGASTYIGALSQNGFSELNSIFASTTATTTAAAAQTCNPLGGFDVIGCLGFLFIPGGPELQNTFVTFRDQVLQRVPWGYFFRAYTIVSSTSTAALPTFTAAFQLGSNVDHATTTLTFDPGDMLAGAATLLTNTRDPQNGKNMRDVFEPLVQLMIALAVIFTIWADLTGSHKHHQDATQHR